MPSERIIASLASTLTGATIRPAARGRAPLSRSASDYPPQGTLISVDGQRVHAQVGPAPEGAGDVILLHGASGSSRDFSFDLMGRLAPRFRAIAFDRPGLGHSAPLPGGDITPAGQATRLDAAAERLGVRRAVIVGHSYGAAVAMAWALERPARVAGIVSLAGATMPWPGGLGPWYRVASSRLGGATIVPLVGALAPTDLVRSVIATIFAPQEPPEGYAEHIGVGLSLRASSLRTNARQLNGLKPHVTAMAARYPSLALPVEVVHGAEDRIVPVEIHGARMVELIPGARLTRLPGVGHMPHHAAPGEAVAAIDRVAAAAGLG